MNWKSKPGALLGASLTGLCLMALAACGSGSSSAAPSSSSDAVSADVGLDSPIKITPPLKVGIYTSSGCASFGQVEDATLTQEAKAANIDLTIFDSCFDSAKQLNQIQSAIQTKQYNVLGVLPVDGQVVCNALSQDAPAAGLLAVPFDQPLCGRFTNEGNDLWQPGTLTYISGYNTKDTLRQWVDTVAKDNPSANVGVVEGVPSDGLSTNTNLLVKEASSANPDFKVVSTVNTDYSSQQGYQKTQALLQAHPEINVIICTQSNITQGAARAIEQAGKTSSIYLADYGGDKEVVALMKKGEVALTGPTFPDSEAKIVIKTLQAVLAGKPVPRLQSVPFHVVTAADVDSYTPEY
jgi:ribose transport system substrate-binding protein